MSGDDPYFKGGFMNWFFLLAAGLLEVAWAIGLKYTDSFTRFWPSIITVFALLSSVFLLAISMRTITVGIAYAVWVGMGVVGTSILGVILFNEPMNTLKVLSLTLIMGGVIGLKLAH